MSVKNKDIRIYKGSIKFGEIAEEVNVHRNTVSRWFNDSEMDEVREAIVKNAIDNIRAKKPTKLIQK